MNILSFCKYLAVMAMVTLMLPTIADTKAQPSTQQRIQAIVGEDVITKPFVKEVQSLLISLGYSPGSADGLIGGKTYSAIQAWANDTGATVEKIWLMPTSRTEERKKGWRCATKAEASSFKGASVCAGGARNMSIRVSQGKVTYMVFSREGNVLPPPENCGGCAIYLDK